MDILADQDVYAATIRLLVEHGHDVVRAGELGLATASDRDLLRKAEQSQRLLLTCDRDYGSLVFIEGVGTGVLYLRFLPSTIEAVHIELRRVLSTYASAQLMSAFVVIEPGRHRIRMIGP